MKAFLAIAILVMAIITMGCAAPAEGQLQNETNVENVTKERFMFVQTAHSGSFVQVTGNESLYNLTLRGVSPTTIAFSDRPDRIVVQAPMQRFLDGLHFGPDNPPNAAIEVLGAEEEEDVAVAELFNPVYDETNQTLRYTARILEQANHSYAEFNERNDKKLPAAFGPAALYIDDCGDREIWCRHPNLLRDTCGYYLTGCCWKWRSLNCVQCRSDNVYVSECIQKFGADCTDIECTCR